jgi:PhnB protein
MNTALFFDFKVDKVNHRIHIDRDFQAPKDLVWQAWTNARILDQWWAPKPYIAVTKHMDFKEGGNWHYYMQGPGGDVHWCLFEYDVIVPEVMFSGLDAFCDENAVISSSKPRVYWNNHFKSHEENTRVSVVLKFEKLEDLETLIQMGFREGFTAGLANLDAYIDAQFQLRKAHKTENRARVATYVNFDGKTEEAFLLYRQAFRTEFVREMQRFESAPHAESLPPMSDSLKNMILHVELPLLGGHILMGTDAPKEMGFQIKTGNNMHIQLEPESREEADRLFKALSEGGTIEMPMQDMFWGSYFGSFTDKFGINWMINHQPISE